MVVEERAAPGVERGDGGHLVVAQREVEDVEVLLHALAVRALGGADHAALQQPTQHDLGDRLAVRLSDTGEDLVAEEVVSSLRKGRPALHGHVFAGHVLLRRTLLEEHVALHLVHGGGDAVERDEIREVIGVEVRRPYGSDHALLVELLHGAPRAEDVAERLMDEIEVNIIEPQPLERRFEAAFGPLVARIRHPQFGRHEHLVARQAARAHGRPDRFLVTVARSRVEQPVADRERVLHGALAFGGVRNLVRAEAELRHPDAVVQGDVLHGAFLSRFLTYPPYGEHPTGGSLRW